MRTMTLHIIFTWQEVRHEEIQSLSVTDTLGNTYYITPNHPPVILSFRKGCILYVSTSGIAHTLDIKGGFLEYTQGILSVCID